MTDYQSSSNSRDYRQPHSSDSHSSRKSDYSRDDNGARGSYSSSQKRSYDSGANTDRDGHESGFGGSAPKRGGSFGGGYYGGSFGSASSMGPVPASTEAFNKNFYMEHPGLAKVGEREIEEFRREHVMTLKGTNIPKYLNPHISSY